MAKQLITFELKGDQFDHAWFFNRFRCDPLGSNTLVTTALGGTPVVNGFVLSRRDLAAGRERIVKYLEDVALRNDSNEEPELLFSVPPSRVYPVNHMNLSRVDDVGEIGLFRYSMNTLLSVSRTATSGGKHLPKTEEKHVVPCYPVVLFRCDVGVQIALIKELLNQ